MKQYLRRHIHVGNVNSKAGYITMNIKKTILCFVILLNISCVIIGLHSPPSRYVDPFYNPNFDDYPLLYLPLIKPIQADRFAGDSLWRVFLPHCPRVLVPNRQDNLVYCYAIEELEKFAVKDGVLMAYSAYVDKEADAYIQENYYHWFVLVPDKKIAEGFQTEDEFREYIQTLGIQDPSWQTPNEAFDKFIETGCLDWIPDCK
jgi:hypothetical protein